MRVVMVDGAAFVADNAAEVVRMMKAEDWSAPPKKREYMVEVAERVTDATSARVRTGTALTFLHDLEAAGFCTVMQLTPEEAEEFNALEDPGHVR